MARSPRTQEAAVANLCNKEETGRVNGDGQQQILQFSKTCLLVGKDHLISPQKPSGKEMEASLPRGRVRQSPPVRAEKRLKSAVFNIKS